ncbi:MAG: hypothetical protein GY713_12040 [Actinomycetia bacterium]|nr:hypothetical protein [Actinomycetes bacterium]
MPPLVSIVVLTALVLMSCSSRSDAPVTDDSDGDDETTGETLPPVEDLVDKGQALSVRNLQLGHCWVGSSFDDADALTKLVAVTDCGQPHQAEVYSVVCLGTFDDDLIIVPCGHETVPLDYPGEAMLDHMANEACLEGFEPFVGVEYSVSTVDYVSFVPGESVWASGDRTIVCSLIEDDASAIRDSLLGAKQ